MSVETVFSVASSAAMAGWLLLIFVPRWAAVIGFIRFGLIAALSLTYAVLVWVYFFRVEDGGFGSIAQVRALFMSDAVLVAGWVHYLAFDLFVGTWIAVAADRQRYSRLLQAPILVATFMFGPLGLLLFYVTRATEMALVSRRSEQ